MYLIVQCCALAAPSGLCDPTFAHAATRKSFFFHRDHEYAGNPGFHRYRAAGTLSWFFVEHSLMHTIVDKIFKTSSPNGVTSESKTVHIPPLHSKLGTLLFSTITKEAQHYKKGWRRESFTCISPF